MLLLASLALAGTLEDIAAERPDLGGTSDWELVGYAEAPGWLVHDALWVPTTDGCVEAGTEVWIGQAVTCRLALTLERRGDATLLLDHLVLYEVTADVARFDWLYYLGAGYRLLRVVESPCLEGTWHPERALRVRDDFDASIHGVEPERPVLRCLEERNLQVLASPHQVGWHWDHFRDVERVAGAPRDCRRRCPEPRGHHDIRALRGALGSVTMAPAAARWLPSVPVVVYRTHRACEADTDPRVTLDGSDARDAWDHGDCRLRGALAWSSAGP